jgi:sorting nexin-1/2
MQEVTAAEAQELVDDVTSTQQRDPVPKVISTEQEIFCIVSKPEKVGEGMNAYVTYKISTKDLDGNTVTVVRRYSDFDWIHDVLKSEYRHVIIPPLPEKAIFDRFSPEFVEYRRKELERFLKRTLAHPELKHSPSLRTFLTASESAIDAERAKPRADPPPPTKPKEEKSFFASFTASITSAVTGPSVELKEIDPFFENQKVYLANLDQQLQVLVQRSNANTKKRQELVATLTDFAHAASLAAGFEVGQDDGLASFWEKLSEILNQMSLLTDELVRGETDLFEDQIKDYIRIVQSCKDLMENRNALLLSLQTSKATLQQKTEKLKGQKNTEIIEAQEATNENEQKFNTLSANAKAELDTFKIKKGHDLRKAIRELVRMNINHQLRVVNLWKELLSELEEIKV